jgi:hypothetical protein
MTDEQRGAEIFLELADLQAERGLGNIQVIRRAGHVAELDNPGEIAELPEIDGRLPSGPPRRQAMESQRGPRALSKP